MPKYLKLIRTLNKNCFTSMQLESHREMYEGYVPMAYNDYLEKMSKYD
jgi:hypothetical protein